MATNTTVALLVLAGGAAVGYVAIKDPPGGVIGAFGNVLAGRPQAAGKAAPTAAGAVAYAPGLAVAASGGTAAEASYSGPSTGAGSAVVAYARTLEGIKYKYAGSSPAEGFDCSGLTQYVYRHAAGISIPRTAAAQQLVGQAVGGVQNAQPGDLLFFGLPAYHVGIYVGPGQMIAAPHTGDVVKQQAIYTTPTSIRRMSGLKSTSSKGISA